MSSKVVVEINLTKYSPETVRYAAYALSGSAYVFIEPASARVWQVSLAPKSAGGAAGLKAQFLSELEDEKLRAGVAAANKQLREFMVSRALSGPQQDVVAADSGLTAAQEKELDSLIAQVEREIKAESADSGKKDPLGLTKTWEEKNAKRTSKGKAGR